MIDINMPIWWQIIQIIGWLEMATLFILIPFENKHQYLYRAQYLIPNNLVAHILVVIIFAIPMITAGIICLLSYFLWFFIFYKVTS